MVNFLSLIKMLARKLLPVVKLPESAFFDYQKSFGNLIQERTFYFGLQKRRVNSLKTESAPGTAETVIKLLKESPPKGEVLDFGCGEHKSEYLKKMGFLVHSSDIYDFDISNYTKIDPIQKLLPFQSKQFEISVISEVIEHVESPWELILEVARVTREYLIITTPNTVSLKSRESFYKKGFLFWFAPENFSYHISPIFPWQMELFCQRHGYKLETTLGNHQIFGLDDKGKTLDYAEALIFKVSLNKQDTKNF